MRANETVRSKLSDFRRKSGITQEDLARRVGVTRQTIISIEKGDYVPSVLLALKIANEFKTNVERIFHYEEK